MLRSIRVVIPRLVLLYPALFAAFPVLWLAVGAPGNYSLADLVILALAIVGATLGVQALIALALRRHRPTLSAFIAMLLVGWFFYFPPISEALVTAGYSLSRPRTLMGLLTVGVLGWLVRAKPRLYRFTPFMALTGSILVGQALVRVGIDQARILPLPARSAVVRNLSKPLPMRPLPRELTGTHRDIYLLILDGYANHGVLQQVYGFSNQPFEDSLRALGFTIPQVTLSNYAHTHLSLASLLNLDYLTGINEDVSVGDRDWTVSNYLIEHNRAVRFLKGQGYAFLFCPSAWYQSTAHNREADLELRPLTRFDWNRALDQSELRRALRRSSLLDLMIGRTVHDTDGEYILGSFAAIGEVPNLSQPTFVVAHILAPHYPYVLDSGCRPIAKPNDKSPPWSNKTGYLHQLRCVNKLVLALVHTIVEHSDTPPIILLQADHGSNTRNQANQSSAREVSGELAAERFGALGAYYVPGGADTAFSRLVTPVNIFRKIFSYYFGAGLPSLPDDLYFSVSARPYEFVRFDTKVSEGMVGPVETGQVR